MKITVIGDRFIYSKFYKEALTNRLSAVVEDLTFETRDIGWPGDPLGHNDEVIEFVGDPAEIAELSKGSHIIATHVAPITRAVLDAAPDLQIIACCRGGPVNVNHSSGWGQSNHTYTQDGSGPTLTIIVKMGAGNVTITD